MTVVRGLKKIKEFNDEREAKFQARQEAAEAGKTRWFKLEDGQTVRVLFLQELDEDSPNFSKKNDLGLLAVEHNNPAKGMFMKKALCTEDEGACWACEQHRKDYKAGWKQKIRLYINVLVDDGKEEPYVALLSQGNGPKSVTPTLLQIAAKYETITDRWFTVTRTGSGLSDTSYTIIPDRDEASDNVEDYDVVDLSKVLRNVPYEQQEAHYTDGQTVEAPKDDEPKVPVSAASVDAEW